jgi:circadian clock protein KaiC
LDEITGGGLPRGRPTLICGGAGCGKTVEFLVHGAMRYGEPGVFLSFEETAEELAQNVRSLGHDLDALEASKLLAVDHVTVERSEIEETGGYDLEGLFIRLSFAIDSIGAKRVVLDTIETLFGNLKDHAILRAELRRLFRWLKDKGVTAVITGEGGDGTLTRHGLEEFVADCVIVLDHRVTDQVSTRRLRIVKYRGTPHGTNEYPFLIDVEGISVLPITSLELRHEVSVERISTGIADLDEMLDGRGYYCGTPCVGDVQARRKMPVFRFRGGREPVPPQHAFDRYRSRALPRTGIAALRGQTALAAGTRAPLADNEQARSRPGACGRHRGPDQ